MRGCAVLSAMGAGDVVCSDIVARTELEEANCPYLATGANYSYMDAHEDYSCLGGAVLPSIHLIFSVINAAM